MAPLSDTLSVPFEMEIIDSLSVTYVFHEFQLICIDLDLILTSVQGSTSGGIKVWLCAIMKTRAQHTSQPRPLLCLSASLTNLPVTSTCAMSFRVTSGSCSVND